MKKVARRRKGEGGETNLTKMWKSNTKAGKFVCVQLNGGIDLYFTVYMDIYRIYKNCSSYLLLTVTIPTIKFSNSLTFIFKAFNFRLGTYFIFYFIIATQISQDKFHFNFRFVVK